LKKPDHTAKNLKFRYGLTRQQYEDMFVAQSGACALCYEPCASGNRLAVDHDHATGRVRSLLCRECNIGLGKFRESQELLRNAADYLDGWTYPLAGPETYAP
jgi:hypothetical protein